ncbi:MAG: hypothetical protein COA71_06585 [SAR86 cluster bacterium]|uniref:Uncharacterized protein n=1 Tax=SAR86 cluster bacterium TaxID=2030880 RepID=A0A2A5CE75_9GAMM|nr:tetratricopeptide repeat protein [Gammaproteobacteria bacterium AH-315-E17]PCJ41676.1 MAG: hypothetical protein COA71_06585 [SAR86 cluster bacterium]
MAVDRKTLGKELNSLKLSLTKAPQDTKLHLKLGNCHYFLQQYEEARSAYLKAISLNKNLPEAHNNIGVVLRNLNKFKEAIKYFKQAVQLQPKYIDAIFNIAHTHLLIGEYEEGWKYYYARLLHPIVKINSHPSPSWQGEPLAGKKILLLAEQGLGDVIQAYRYIKRLQALGAEVILECPKPLLGLFENDGIADQIVIKGHQLPWVDFHIYAMSIPAVLKDDENSFSYAYSYLKADPRYIKDWKTKLEQFKGLKIGICWQGNPNFKEDQWRSFKLGEFAAIADIAGISLISIQKGEHGTLQIKEFKKKYALTNIDEYCNKERDFQDTAAIISGLDLVISSDTSVAHLAGALGIPTWIALSCYADWRWLASRTDSPWYPSIKIFRQRIPGDWPQVFKQIKTTLQLQLKTFNQPEPPAPNSRQHELKRAGRFYQEGAVDKAIASCLDAINTNPAFTEAYNLLGMIYGEKKNFGLAILHFKQSLLIQPSQGLTLNNLGLCLYNTKQFKKAIEHFIKALGLISDQSADKTAIYNNLGLAYTGTGALPDAEKSFQIALELAPNNIKAWKNYGIALKKLNKLELAEKAFRKAITLNSEYADAHYLLGSLLLLQNRTREAWPEYQWRFQRDEVKIRSHSSPLWTGQSLKNKTLLLLAEQGIGDMLQAIRFAKQLKAEGTRLIVESNGALKRLFTFCPEIDQVILRNEPLPQADYHIHLMSIPAALNINSDQFSSVSPYLKAEPVLVQEWGRLLGKKKKFRIGIIWQGNPTFWEDQWRSIPLKEFLIFSGIPEIEIVSLQKGQSANWQLTSLENSFSIKNSNKLKNTERDFMDTAAIMMNLDLIITSDTSVAHLTGALGIPVWVLLGQFSDWRWLQDREDSPWYPSMRLFRQGEAENWSEVFQQVLLTLAENLKSNKPEAAKAIFNKLIELNPLNPNPCISLGMLLETQGKSKQALACYQQAIKAAPDFALAYYCEGNAFRKFAEPNLAKQAYQKAIQIQPNIADAHYNLGNIYMEEEKFELAEKHYHDAIKISSKNAEYYVNLGFVQEQQFRLKDAEKTNLQALSIRPDQYDAHINIGNVLKKKNQQDKAETAYRKAISLNPDSPDGHFNLATLLLLQGRFKEAWPEYRWRLKRKIASISPHASIEWTGEPLQHKTIIILAEQGMGDIIQGVRYVKHLKTESTRIIIECPSPLHTIFNLIPEIDQLVIKGTSLPTADYHVPIMNIPGILNVDLNDLADGQPYLKASLEAINEWKRKLGKTNKFRIGIVWQGNPDFPNDKARSIPLMQFSSLAKISSIELVSLQVGAAGTDQISTFKNKFPLTVVDETLNRKRNFMDTAALMLNMDLIIASDTSVAHLAGALNVPVWVLLQKSADWRWMLDRTDSPWYPSMRLFRQQQHGNWEQLFETVILELGTLIQHPPTA